MEDIKKRDKIDESMPVLMLVDSCRAHGGPEVLPVDGGLFGMVKYKNLYMVSCPPGRTATLNVGDRMVNKALRECLRSACKKRIADLAIKYALFYSEKTLFFLQY
jgi:hypothetical protein